MGQRNLILSHLGEPARGELLSNAQTIAVVVGERLMRESEEHIYFPLTTIIANLRIFSDGASVEVGMIGREGFLGVHPLLGVEHQLNASLVQHEGEAVRVPTSVVVRCFRQHESVRNVMLPYVHYLLTQISQIASCNRYHPPAERLARWLLCMHDRSETDQLMVTQEFLAFMLATRRASINAAVADLRDCGAIASKRNAIEITNRRMLETRSCECYAALAREAQRTLAFSPRSAR